MYQNFLKLKQVVYVSSRKITTKKVSQIGYDFLSAPSLPNSFFEIGYLRQAKSQMTFCLPKLSKLIFFLVSRQNWPRHNWPPITGRTKTGPNKTGPNPKLAHTQNWPKQNWPIPKLAQTQNWPNPKLAQPQNWPKMDKTVY